MKQTIEQIRDYFQTGDKPTQDEYYDTWDSFWHKDEIISSDKVESQSLQQVTDKSSTTTNNITITTDFLTAELIFQMFDTGFRYRLVADDFDGHFKIMEAGSNLMQITSGGVITVPSTSIAHIDIGGDKSLVTKEYADANYSGGGSPTLEGYTESGTRAGGDLLVTIGDYDHSNEGSRIIIDDDGNDPKIQISIEGDSAHEFTADSVLIQNQLDLRAQNGFIASFNTNSLLTSSRSYQVPDKNGTIAMLSDINDSLSLASSNTTNTNAVAAHVGGMNDIDSTSKVTLTIQDNATEDIPVGSTLTYNQINDGRVVVAYSGSASGDAGQTYKKGDVLTLWHKSLDKWVILNQPHALDSKIEGEPIGSDQVFNVVSLTQAEYDAGTPVATTLYNITDA